MLPSQARGKEKLRPLLFYIDTQRTEFLSRIFACICGYRSPPSSDVGLLRALPCGPGGSGRPQQVCGPGLPPRAMHSADQVQGRRGDGAGLRVENARFTDMRLDDAPDHHDLIRAEGQPVFRQLLTPAFMSRDNLPVPKRTDCCCPRMTGQGHGVERVAMNSRG